MTVRPLSQKSLSQRVKESKINETKIQGAKSQIVEMLQMTKQCTVYLVQKIKIHTYKRSSNRCVSRTHTHI